MRHQKQLQKSTISLKPYDCKPNPILTRVVGIPTDSAAWKAYVKFLLLLVGDNVSKGGSFPGRYVCNKAQRANPSFQLLEKLVISIPGYSRVFNWHHFSKAFRLEPPLHDKLLRGSFFSAVCTRYGGVISQSCQSISLQREKECWVFLNPGIYLQFQCY